jgi:lauroyl/myristoyl acyltransferase
MPPGAEPSLPQAAAPQAPRPRARRPLVRVKDLAWLGYLYPLRWLTGALPLPAAYALWDALARIGAALLRGPRRRLEARLQLAYPSPADRPRTGEIAADHFRRSILRFGDDLLLPRLTRERTTRSTELVHPERLAAALARGNGALLVSGHFLASRAGRHHLAAIGYPTASVRNLDPRDASLGVLGERFVQRRYVDFLSRTIGDEIAARATDSGLRIMARLRAGGLVDLHVDAAFSREMVVREFLGATYAFGAGAFHLAYLVGAPVVPIQCLGDSRRLTIEFFEPIDPADWPDRHAYAAAALDRSLRILEQEIRAAPSQWDLWIRW